MSILRYKRMLLADGGVLRGDGGGGGGSPAPTQSTSYNTNVPEYARPYVENMLQSTQKQIYNDDMTSFRPYQPYSTDVNNYFAGFSPLQQQAQSETANMQTPGGYGAASAMTGMAGLGSLGLAGQMANTGNQYNQMATDPYAMQGFMSPYMQNVVDYQKGQAIRDYTIGQQGLRAQAARSGAFGGSRQAIQEAESQRSLGSQLQGIEAQGAQQAFQNAQQAQQFGANLGLQGQQAGLQGLNQFGQLGGQLASIGGQQQASDLARLQAQQQVGQQQQTMEQNKINQAISNYATAQQYPFMQLGIMNSMLRGLPLQQTTTATYQQQPSTAQQLTGLGGAALSYLGGGKKEGGIIGMKEGGTVPGYKYGDLISDPQLQGMSQGLSPDQLQGRIADPQVTPNERGIFQGTQQAQQRMAANPMAAQQMAQAAPPPQMAQAPAPDARMGGIAQAGGDMFNTMGYAGGGIIAFANGDLIEEQRLQAEKDAAEQDAAKEKKAESKTAFRGAAKEAAIPAGNTREGMLAQTQALLKAQGFKPGATAEEEAYNQMLSSQQAGMGKAFDAKERANMAKAFLKMGANPRGFLPGAIEGAESYITGAGEIAAGKETREAALAEARAKYAAGQRARAAGDIAASDKLFEEANKLENQANIAKGNNAATIRAAEIHAGAAGQSTKAEEAKVDAYMKDHPGATRSEAYAAVAQYSRGETTELNRIRYADAVLSDDPEYLKYKNSKKFEDQQKAAEIRRRTYERYGVTMPSTAAAPTGPVPTEVSVGGKTYNRKDYPQMTDQQWADYARQNKG